MLKSSCNHFIQSQAVKVAEGRELSWSASQAAAAAAAWQWYAIQERNMKGKEKNITDLGDISDCQHRLSPGRKEGNRL